MGGVRGLKILPGKTRLTVVHEVEVGGRWRRLTGLTEVVSHAATVAIDDVLVTVEGLADEQAIVVALALETEVVDLDETLTLSWRGMVHVAMDAHQWMRVNAEFTCLTETVVVADDATGAAAAILAKTAFATVEMCMRIFGVLSLVHF